MAFPRKGLLASHGFDGQPVKGIYFFPGEGVYDNLWTTVPRDDRDRHWNSDPSTRGWVLDRMVQAHVNTVVASFWGEMFDYSPMVLDRTSPKSPSWTGLLDAVASKPLVVLPAMEGGTPGWMFADEFPHVPGTGAVAPRFVERIGWLCEMFAGRMELWAALYGNDGVPRYAINIVHTASNVIGPGGTADSEFAWAFDTVAREVRARYGVDVGFTLDTIALQRYSPSPQGAGPILSHVQSVLAIHGFESEVFSSLVHGGDNNGDNNIARMADWKRAALNDWVAAGVPVILDVSNGFDGRVVWGPQSGFWGDNRDYTDDRWRNWMSQLKGPGIVGISVDCWNGYTEGYATVPSRQHQDTAYNWLADLLWPDPRWYDSVHYVNGAATHRVYGAIAEKWIKLGADRAFGPPVSDAVPAGQGAKQDFADGKAIYWGPTTGAFEVHGLIGTAYRNDGGAQSCLGLPISDEESWGSGRINHFQYGEITWTPRAAAAQIRYDS
jgi:hypothetical protein